MTRGDGRPAARAVVMAAVVCLAAAVAVQYVRDRAVPAPADGETVLYVPSGPAMARLALGYDAILADVYWIRAVQWFGGRTLAERAALRHDLLYPLLDITTSLDPYFNIAYRYGSIFIAEGAPNPGRPDLAIKLLEKGMRAAPDRWQYPYDIAFVYYWWLHDYRKASEWFRVASRVPHSPEWLPGLAAITLSESGDRRGARFLWRRILEDADQEYMRRTAEHRLTQLDILDELDRLNAALDQVARETGVRPTTWEPLARRGWLRRVPPVDPSGTPYLIDPATGRAVLPPSSRYSPLPTGTSSATGATGAPSAP